MRFGYLAFVVLILILIPSYGAEDEENSISFEEYTLYLGDRVEIGDYRVELVDIQSLKDGLTVLLVSKSGGKLDEQRVLVSNSPNNFDGGSGDGGLTITVTEIFDELSARVRIEYPENLGHPRKRSAEKPATRAEPNLILTKSFDRESLNVGDQVKVTVALKNVGTDTAYNIEVFDQPPLAEFVYVVGYPPKIKEQLAPEESDSAVYYMDSVKEGSVTVPPIEVRYKDSKDNLKSNTSSGLTVTVKPARKPNMEMRIDPVKPIKHGEAALVNVTLLNSGQATAYRIEVDSEVRPADGLEVVSGSLDSSYFEILPGSEDNYSALVKGTKSGNYTINFKVSYQSSEGMMLKEKALGVAVLEREYKYLYYLTILPVLLIAIWIFRRYKEYKY